jgi:catechol 2,3-dioxygenase-like lactoylglutathione lyase family enzyme
VYEERVMKFTGSTPNLFTAHVDRSVAFYRDVLGFSVVTTVPDAAPFVFVLLQRDDVSLYVNDRSTVEKDAPDSAAAMASVVVGRSGVAIFIHVQGIDELWESVHLQAPVVMPLITQWYGMTEFTVADPDGYIVTFAERKA